MTRISRAARRISDEPMDRFGLLLGLLIAAFLVSGIDGGAGVRVVVGLLNLLLVVVAFTSTGLRANARLVVALLVLGSVGSILVSSFRGDSETSIGAAIQVFVVLLITLAVVRRVLEHEVVGTQTLLGAIAAYFLIGQLFAWAYIAIPGYADGDVIDPTMADQVPMYYSYVVLTTLGFGDVVPVDSFAQRVTVFEALVGQMFLATFIARLVALYSRRPSAIDTQRDQT